MRQTGLQTLVEVENGGTNYPLAALTMDETYVGRGARYKTSSALISPFKPYNFILDGVISGFKIYPSENEDAVMVGPGKAIVGGQVIEITTAQEVTGIARAEAAGEVLISAISINPSKVLNLAEGTTGELNKDYATAGGYPYSGVGEILLGYVLARYEVAVEGAVLTTEEIDSESKEYSAVPTGEIRFHDGGYDGASNKGCIFLSNALPKIHGADPVGTPTARRAVYFSYTEPDFEELPESFDFNITRDVSSTASQAYGELYEQKALGTKSWSSAGSAYWNQTGDFIDTIDATKRWVKIYPDRNNPEKYYFGIAVIKTTKTMPKGDTKTSAITLEGDGQLFTA